MSEYSSPVSTARDYYNSEDADRFYSTVWGGEDIHIGLYERSDEAIAAASQRTVHTLAGHLEGLIPDDGGDGLRVLDLGSGYCGAARTLAQEYGCRVTGLNLSEVENERARELNAAAGLSERITVIDGSFESIPAENSSFDVAWSQDAILHSGERRQVLQEVGRVLRPAGRLVFTDPMQADDCPEGVLDPILARIHLDSLGSPGFYRATCRELGFSEKLWDERTAQLVRHYTRVLEETTAREGELEAAGVSADYVARMKQGLQRWIEGGEQGWLAWGIFVFEAP